MPKVTDEYLTEKRNYILECTGEILKGKPLYSVTIRDIIKKAGFGHGVFEEAKDFNNRVLNFLVG